MNKGQSIVEIATELERQREAAKDYVAPLGAVKLRTTSVVTTPTGMDLVVDGINGSSGLRPLAHRQMGDHLGIPRRYYERMRTEQPALLAENVNTWFHESRTDRRMFRTLDGDVRAFLSDRYRPLDNYGLAEAILPTLQDRGAKVVSAAITETRLYIQATVEDIEGVVPGSKVRNDVVRSGITISNSEVGLGALKVEPMLYRLICANGMISGVAFRKYHVGRRLEMESEVYALLSSATRAADDRALWLKVRDVVRGAFDRDIFEAEVVKMGNAAGQEIESEDLSRVVEVTTKQLGIETHSNGILKHLAAGGDLSRWGLANAITNTANDVGNYDVAVDLERAGGKVIELGKQDWKAIAQAA